MAAESSSPPSFTPRRKWTVGFDVVVRTVVVFAVVVMTNYLAGKLFHREYLSAHTQTELASRTVSLVESLTNEVKVTVYYDREDELFTTLKAMLREYGALNPRVRIEIVDYLRDAADAQRVKLAYKLPEATKNEEKNFIIFDCEGRYKVISGGALADYDLRIHKDKSWERPPTSLKAEAMFNGCLLAVTSGKPLKAYVLQGHGEHSLESGDEVGGYLDFKSLLEQNYIKVEPLALIGTNTVPLDCNLLIVPGPRAAIPDGELEKIDNYLNEGGRLFALFNAASTERRAGLEKILARWGVLVSEAVVQDPQNSLNTLRSAPGADVTVAAMNPQHPVVKLLFGFNLNLIMPRPIFELPSREKTPETPKVEVLFATEKTATLINDATGQARQYPLAVAVERAPAAGVVTGRGTTRMILVGDSYFLANGPMKFGANRAFAGYAVNWLLERPQLMAGIELRPIPEFRVVLTVAQMRTVRWLLLGALPGGILLFGGLVWWRRQK